jgi:hypothetical protein
VEVFGGFCLDGHTVSTTTNTTATPRISKGALVEKPNARMGSETPQWIDQTFPSFSACINLSLRCFDLALHNAVWQPDFPSTSVF